MKKFNKFNPIRNMGVGVAVLALALVFSFMFLIPKAHAQKKYFNSYYVSLNAGGIQSKPASSNGLSLSNISGATINMSFGKNWNIDNFVIGGEITLGYANNGSWTLKNFDGYGDNAKFTLTSSYFIAAIKAGYAFKNIMPFVKLGRIGYSYDIAASFSGPYGNAHYVSPVSSEGGFLYGAGIEYMFNHRWGMTAQYFAASLNGGDKTANYTIGVDYNF